jgi:16S rRNA processing protein RimM
VKITEYKQWFLQNKNEDWRSVKILNGRAQGKNIVVQLDGVNTREQAETLKGTQIAIHQDQLETLPKNEYYWKDLIGHKVETTEDVQLGKLDWIFNTGSNDVLIIKSDDTSVESRERMIPFLLDDVVVSIDMDKSLIIVDWDPEF